MIPSTRPTDDAFLGDDPLSPAEMLALSTRQQERMTNSFLGPIVSMLVIWGIAWFLGFLLLWAAHPGSGSPLLVPEAVANPSFALLIIAGAVLSSIIGSRMSRGIRGSSNFSGAVYGMSWTIGSVAIWLIGVALMHAGMSDDLAMLFFPAGYAMLAGLLYLAGAALWRNVGQLLLGLWIIAVGVGAAFAGFPANLLVMSLLGGGGFLVGAVAMVVGRRFARTRRG